MAWVGRIAGRVACRFGDPHPGRRGLGSTPFGPEDHGMFQLFTVGKPLGPVTSVTRVIGPPRNGTV
jgi:hypothetical protein